MRRPSVPRGVGPVVVAVVVPLCAAPAWAEPGDSTEPPARRMSPALEAALGVPPDDTPPLQGTFDPGYTEQGGTRPADQTYGSTASTVGPDGSLIQGLQLVDPNVLQEYRGDIEPPQFHIVQQGDTLWDISEVYLHDPYLWPKLWSWNEHVTNAHWIFPGDRIRLYDPFSPQGQRDRSTGPSLSFSKTRVPKRVGTDPVLLTQTAFVDAAQFDTAMTVIGGGDAKVMMATLDTIYLDYDKANPPIPGERLVVYAPQEKVYDLTGKHVIGWVVEVVGDVEIEAIARKAAEGTVASAVNPIQRGYKVGPLRRRFERVDPVPASRTAAGLVVATLNDAGPIAMKKSSRIKSQRGKGDNDVLAGEQQFVIVSMGEADGVEVGNVLEVVRKGDEYSPKRTFDIPYEDGWPRRVIGALLVVQVLPTTSLAISIFSRRELERGDHVELRGPGLDRDGTAAAPGPGATRQGKTLEADGSVRRDDGKASGGGRVKIGQ